MVSIEGFPMRGCIDRQRYDLPSVAVNTRFHARLKMQGGSSIAPTLRLACAPTLLTFHVFHLVQALQLFTGIHDSLYHASRLELLALLKVEVVA